jgi:iron complex transport system permease protein
MKRLQQFFKADNPQAAHWLIGASALLLVLTALASLCLGAAFLSLRQVLELHDIVRFVRVPRTLAAIFAGAGLAGAGVIIQTLLSNPLASPSVIGVNAGAGLFSVVTYLLFPFLPALQPLAAFLGALCAVLLVYGTASKTGVSKVTLVLAGVVFNSLFNAITEALYTFFPKALPNISAFRVGGLAAVQTSVLYPAILLIALAVWVVLRRSDSLELLSLGDETAHSLGVRVKPLRFLFLLCAACMAGAAVSFAGLLGFVGLIVPQAARLAVGQEINKLLPLSLLWGGLLLLVCDTVSRTAFAPYEVPVGILLSLIGAPVFFWMLLHRKRGSIC